MPRADMEVDLGPIREAFKRSDMSPSELARRLGWMRTKNGYTYPDDTRAKQALGLVRHRSGGRNGKHYFRQHCSYERAMELVQAMDVDPIEVNL